MALYMRGNVRITRSARFSETARPRPAAHEVGRDVGDGTPVAELRRGRADDVAERAAERAEAREPDLHAHVGHRPVGGAEEVHRPLDAAPLQVAVRRLPEGLLERADERRLREA